MTSTFVASGTYGCVFKPALKCNGVADIAMLNNKISKIVKSDTARNMGLIANHIKQLPDYDKYFIVNNDNLSCPYPEINIPLQLNPVEISKCPIITSTDPTQLFNTVMDNGGISLGSFLRQIDTPPMIEHRDFVKFHFKYLVIFSEISVWV